jgi:hypothetical protein
MNQTTLKSLAVVAGTSLLSSLAASAAVYSESFDLPNGTNTFTGATLTSGAGIPATVQGNALELTNVNNFSTQNSFNIAALAGSSLGFTISFDVVLIDAPGGNPPADGLSVSYGNFGSGANYGDEGQGGSSISWIVDTWDNQVGDQGIRSKINGVNDFVQNFIPLADGQTIATSVLLTWSPINGMSMELSDLGGTIFANRPTPGFVPSDAHFFGIGARTGNATETVLIDNLVITTVPETTAALLAGAAGFGFMMVRRRRQP